MKGKSTFILLLFSLFFSASVGAQEIDVSGKVTAKSDGSPIPGVSVVVQGSKTGVATNAAGNFSIRVPKGGVLVFSQIGLATQTFTVNTNQPITIAMVDEVGDLSELVVIGYGSQKKSVVTGSISRISSTDIENKPVMRIEQSLQGRASGLTITTNSGQPGEGANILIRGRTNISNSDPLFVVDGTVIFGGIDYLSQSDISSIEVLKDASAAIYGTQAANGVILITTKKGSASEKVRVSYNGYLGTQAPARTLDLLNSTEYATLYNEAQLAGSATATPRFPNPASLGEGTDWQAAVFNNSAKIQNHELGLSGGNAKSTYYSSFSYFDQDGIVASSNSKYKRFTARFNSDHNLSRSIKIGNTLSYTRNNSVGVSTNSEYGSPLSRAINIDPLTPIIETDPAKFNLPIYTGNPVVRNADGFPYGISSYAQSEVLNPIAALAVAQGNGWSDKLVGNIFLEAEVIKGLKIRGSAGGDLAFWGAERFTPIHYLNSINQATITSYNREINRGLAYIIDYTANYSRTIGGHSFSALAGYSFQKNSGETQGGTKEGIPVDNIRDASLQFPVTRASDVFYGGEYKNTLNSVFGRITYDYKEKYLLTAITRRDGSSKFGPNNKYGYFPSASIGWVASKEDFFPKGKVIDLLKFRGSYGILGNNSIGDNLYIATVSGGRNYTIGNGQTLVNGVSPNALSNADLKWEETSILDVGVDLAFLNNTFTFTADYFHKKTYGMLQPIVVPSYVGNNGPIGNVADNSNKGFDFELGYRNKTGEFSYSFNANASFVKNTTDFLGDDKTFINQQGITPQNLTVTRTQVGSSFGAFYGYVSDGLFQNATDIANYKNSTGALIQPNAKPGDIKFRDLNNDGLISDEDRQILGNSLPDFTYGLTASFGFKNFDFYVLGQGVSGNMIFNGLRRFDLPTSNYTTDILSRWTGEGTSNSMPRLTLQDDNKNYSRVSSVFLESGSYFRIKTMQLGYTLPNKISTKAGIDKLRFYVMANNLVTITKYKGYDPEIGGGSLGVDRGYYPQARTFYAGINFGF